MGLALAINSACKEHLTSLCLCSLYFANFCAHAFILLACIAQFFAFWQISDMTNHRWQSEASLRSKHYLMVLTWQPKDSECSVEMSLGAGGANNIPVKISAVCAARGIELLSVELFLIRIDSPGVRDPSLMIFHACVFLPFNFIRPFNFLQILPTACWFLSKTSMLL